MQKIMGFILGFTILLFASENFDGFFVEKKTEIKPGMDTMDVSNIDTSLIIPVCFDMSDTTIRLVKENIIGYSFRLARKDTICCNPHMFSFYTHEFANKRYGFNPTHCESRYVFPKNSGGITTSVHDVFVDEIDSITAYRDSTHCGYPTKYDVKIQQDDFYAPWTKFEVKSDKEYIQSKIGKVFAHEKSVYVFCNGFYTNLRTNFYVKVTGICSDKK